MSIPVSVSELPCVSVAIVALPTVLSGRMLNYYFAGQHNTETSAREGKELLMRAHTPAETFMCACMRPTEATCFRIRKCANNRQLIVAFYSKVFTTRICSPFLCHTYTQNAVCATCIYANSDWRIFRTRKQEYACVSYTRMTSVLLRRT